jgi:putative ABC transport system permease protein
MAERPRRTLFSLLLRLLPREFRGDFGRAMEADFAAQERDATRAGEHARLRLWLRTVPSLVRLAFVERRGAFASDLHFSFRMMARAPGFTAAAAATLAIGIGATTAVFSTVNATLLRPLPYPLSDQLVDVHTKSLGAFITTGLLSPVEIYALNDAHDVVARAAGYLSPSQDVTILDNDGRPSQLAGTAVTDGFFEVLGLPMTLGRAFTPEEHARGVKNAPLPAVVLSYDTWKTLYGRDPQILSRMMHLSGGMAVSVVGVAAPGLDVPHGTQFWFNARLSPQEINHNYGAILRLRPGATMDILRAEGAVRMADLARTIPSDVDRAYVMRSLVSSVVGDLRPLLLIVLGATLLLLVLAASNVTNLLLARGTARSREMAVRAALGAGRGRVVRQMVTESLALATVGTVAGVALAFGAVHAMLVLGASSLPRLQSVPFDGRVLLFAIGVLAVSAVAMGVAPAWRLSRVDIRTLLNDSGRTTSASRGTSRTMGGLIVAEIALAVALVAGAAWLVQSFARLRATDPGFVAGGRLVADVTATRRLRSPEARAWQDGLVNAVRSSTPGLTVGSATTFPFLADLDGTLRMQVQGRPYDLKDMRGARIRIADAGFFTAMGSRLLRGRFFSSADRHDTERVAIVNRAFVRMFFGDEDPLNRTIAFGYPNVDPATSSRIVGVVENIRYKSLEQDAEPSIYLPLAAQESPPRRVFVVAASRDRDLDELVAPVQTALKEFDPQAIVRLEPATSIVSATLERQELGMTLMLIFGVTALVLGAIGIYGVIAYAAGQRRSEIATRMALGASRADVFWLMIGSGERLGFIGLLLGLGVAHIGGRVVARYVFAMRASDPRVLAGAFLAVALVTLVAIAIPAVRTCRLDPSSALRSD